MVASVDRGIPVPEWRRPARVQYPTVRLEVGDSFLYKTTNRRSAASYVRKVNILYAPKKFTWRAVEDAAIRIWRIA